MGGCVGSKDAPNKFKSDLQPLTAPDLRTSLEAIDPEKASQSPLDPPSVKSPQLRPRANTINSKRIISGGVGRSGSPIDSKGPKGLGFVGDDDDDDDDDEDDAKHFYQQSARTKALVDAGGRCGLQNLGNTCFMNASIQCLSHATPLTDHFLSGNYKTEVNADNALGLGGHMAHAYAGVLQQLWRIPGSKKAKAVAPKKFKSKLGQFASQFNGFEQHDAQEFLAFLMDGLHEDLNRVKKKPYVEVKDSAGRPDETVAAESWFGYLQRNKSIVVDLFQGQLKSTVQCLQCNNVNVTFDPFMCLSLPVTDHDQNCMKNLDQCLEAFTSKESLDGAPKGEDCYRCGKCLDFVSAEKKFDLWKSPPWLVVHLKRFKFSRNYKKSKIQDLIDFPLEGWDIGSFFPYARRLHKVPPIYDLIAVTNHHGGSSSGHYTATVLDKTSGDWYLYDDSSVKKTSRKKVVTECAYVLFYAQRLKKSIARQSITVPHLWPHRMSAIPSSILSQTVDLQKPEIAEVRSKKARKSPSNRSVLSIEEVAEDSLMEEVVKVRSRRTPLKVRPARA